MATSYPVRWIQGESASAAERNRRSAIEVKIDAWWTEFQRSTDRIVDLFSRKTKWDLPNWMHEHLGAVERRLMWEYGPAVGCNGHRLVITPEAAKHLRPLTDAVLARAPLLDGWEFYAYRLPEDVEQAHRTVRGRTDGDLSGVKVHAAIGEHHRIDLTYYSPRIADEDDEQATNDSFVATEALLGEERLDKWIGEITAAPMPGRQKPGIVTLEQLAERVDTLVMQIKDQTPDAPLHEIVETAGWTMFKAEPREASDYLEQFDMFVGSSVHAPMWMAARSSVPFCSERFSRFGETFCYVKLDGSEGLDEEKFADKSEIEDALNAVLKPRRLGCHIGGGTGLRYSYIDLALTNVPEGIAAIRKRLQQGNVPKRSWILFFDDYLAAEWIGIYDESPPPPLPDFDA
jgi:hypothetical protein